MSKSLRDLFRVLDKYKSMYLLSGLLLIISILFRSFEPRILQIAVDHVIGFFQTGKGLDPNGIDWVARTFLEILPDLENHKVGYLLAMLALSYVIVSLFRGGLLFASDALKSWCAEKVAQGMRDTSFAHVQQLPLSFFSKITRGELIQRCTGDIDTIKDFLKSQVIAIIRVVSIFGFAFMMMALINWQLALICILVGPLFIITAYLFFNKEKEVWRKHEAESDKLNDMIQENLNGIRLVAAYANEQHEISRFRVQNQQKLKMGLKHNLLHSLFWPLTDMIGFIQVVISMIVGGYFTVNGLITVGEFLSFYTYMYMAIWPLRDLGRVLSEMGMATVAMDRMAEILSEAQESSKGEKISEIIGEVEFQSVSFGYKADEQHALRNVSFQVKPGEKLAIIGPTGSGKSTLVKLLLRLYEPSEGIILLDGKPLAEYAAKSVRHKIGLALQKPFLFSTTIRGNIAYTQPEADFEYVLEAAKIAQIQEVRNTFPEGFETKVGEKGVTLSGGQKQRVALARTILAEPDLLILDDITSAVDTETEQAIFEALSGPMGKKTTLIISHRITSIQEADRIIVMEKGQIIQEGTPDELAKIPGYYQEIHQIQQAVEQEINLY